MWPVISREQDHLDTKEVSSGWQSTASSRQKGASFAQAGKEAQSPCLSLCHASVSIKGSVIIPVSGKRGTWLEKDGVLVLPGSSGVCLSLSYVPPNPTVMFKIPPEQLKQHFWGGTQASTFSKDSQVIQIRTQGWDLLLSVNKWLTKYTPMLLFYTLSYKSSLKIY